MKTFVLLFALVALCHGKGYDYVAKFYGDVRTAVIDPSFYTSQFSIETDLHVKFSDVDSTDFYFEFRNPKAYVANGEMPISGKTKSHTHQPFPAEVEKYFTEPFLVKYTKDHSKLQHIYTKSKDEPAWSLNFKKAVSTQLEFNVTSMETVKTLKEKMSYSEDEPTIFGNCHTHITLSPYDPKVYQPIVEKFFSPEECQKYSEHYYTSMEKTPCHHGLDNEKKMSNSVSRKYYMGEVKDFVFPHAITRVESNSKISYFPFRAHGDTNIVLINQTIVLQEINKIDFTEHAADFTVEHENTYHFNDQTEFDILKEINYYITEEDYKTQKTNTDVCVAAIKKFVGEVDDFDHLYYIFYKFPFFTFDDLNECYQNLNKKEDKKFIKLFYEVLPNIGSRPAIDFMIHLFEKEKIKTSIASDMMKSLPFTLRIYNEQTLKDLKRIVSDDYVVKPEVKSNAILAYGTLVFKTFKSDPKSEHVKEYVEFYYEHLKNAKSYQEQLTWLHGLVNIQHGDVWKYVLPIVRGEQVLSTKYGKYLRLHAIIAAEKFVYTHQTEYYDAIWPIITGTHVELRLRIAALRAYMKGMHNTADFSRIFWYMQSVIDPHFYRFFETAVRGFAETNNHCNTVLETYAQDVVPFFKNFGKEVSTEAFVHESFDETYGLGTKIVGGYFADVETNAYNTFFVTFHSYVGEKKLHVYTFYFTFDGIKDAMGEFVKVFSSENPQDGLAKFVTKMAEKENLHFEVTVEFNERVVYTHNFFDKVEMKKVNFEEMFMEFMEYFNSLKHSDIFVEQAFMMDRLIPTEMGIPAIVSFRMPVVSKFTEELSNKDSPKTSMTFYRSFHGYNGIKMFSPFTSTWHGVQREYEYSMYIPISFSFDTKAFTEHKKIVFTVDTKNFEESKYFEFYSNVRTISFVEHTTDAEYVKKSSDSDKIYTVTQNKNNVGTYTETKTFEEFGIDYNINVECETYRTEPDLYGSYVSDIWHTEYISKFGKVPFFDFLNHYSTHVMTYYLSPSLVQCEHDVYLSKSEKYPVESYKFEISFDGEKEHEDEVFDSMKFYGNFSLDITKPEEDDSILWTGSFEVEHENAEIFSGVEFEANRYVKGKPYKNMCFTLNKNLYRDYIDGSFNFYFSESFDKECKYDQFYVMVDYQAKKSYEQTTSEFDKFLTYEECYSTEEYYSFKSKPSYPCIVAHTSLRDVQYTVYYDNVPNDVNEFFTDLFTFFVVTYQPVPEFTYDYEVRNGFVVELNYPMTTSGVFDVQFRFPDSKYSVSSEYYPHTYFFEIPNTHFSKMFNLFKAFDHTETCVLKTENHKNYHVHYHELEVSEFGKHYELLASKESDWAVYGMHNKDHVDFKFMFQNSTGYITVDKSHGEKKFIYKIDDEIYNHMNYYDNFENIYNIKLFPVMESVVLVVEEAGFYAVYDGDSLKVEFVELPSYFQGECINAIKP